MIKEVLSMVALLATFLSCSEAQPSSSTQSDVTIQGHLRTHIKTIKTEILRPKVPRFQGFNIQNGIPKALELLHR